MERKTVRRYVQAPESLERERGHEFDDACVHEVAERVQARALPAHTAEWIEVVAHRARIEEWLGKRRPLRLSKIHVLLKRDFGLKASYDTLRRFAMEELGWSKRPATVRVDDPPPGQEAQIDFGYMGELEDVESGKRCKLHVLVVTLSREAVPEARVKFADVTSRTSGAGIREELNAVLRDHFSRERLLLAFVLRKVVEPGPHLRAECNTARHATAAAGRGDAGVPAALTLRIRTCLAAR